MQWWSSWHHWDHCLGQRQASTAVCLALTLTVAVKPVSAWQAASTVYTEASWGQKVTSKATACPAPMLADSGEMLKGCPICHLHWTAASPVFSTSMVLRLLCLTGVKPNSRTSGTCLHAAPVCAMCDAHEQHVVSKREPLALVSSGVVVVRWLIRLCKDQVSDPMTKCTEFLPAMCAAVISC